MAHFVAVAIEWATCKEKKRKGDKEKENYLPDHLLLVLETEI